MRLSLHIADAGLRHEVRNIKEYISEFRFLKDENLDTLADISNFLDKTKSEITELEHKRSLADNKKRRAQTPEEKQAYKDERKAITEHITPLRKKLKKAEQMYNKSPRLLDLIEWNINWKEKLMRGVDIVKLGGIPAIVPQDLFDRVQERMAANKKAPAKHKAEDEYLLTTKLFCGKCGCFMVGESGTSHQKNKVHRYYKCVSVKNHKGCDKKTVRKEWLENLVIAQIRSIIFDDELIDNLANSIMELQGAENTALPLLKMKYAETQKAIDNLLNAIQQGILTPSTKQRMEELEQQKSELSVQIMKEEMIKPSLTKDQIVFWLYHFRKLNTDKLEHRSRLIDSFVNAIFLYDDRITFTFNYKDGSKTITFTELEKSGLGSDINALAAGNRN